MTSTSMNIDQMMAQVAEQVATAKANAVLMAEVTGRGEAEDGKVTVTVTAAGTLKALDLDPRAMRLASVDLAKAVLEASELARADAADQVRAIWGTSDTGGLDMAAVAQGDVDLSADLDRRLSAATDALRQFR